MQSVPPSAGAAADDACARCRAPLGRNELFSIPSLSVGRRFAYDPSRQRVWAVCPSCRGWCARSADLAADIVAECERHHRSAARPVESDGVSCARLENGVELIRIGGASTFERAAWRYGDRLVASGRLRLPTWGEAAEAWLLERSDRVRGVLAGVPYLVAGLALGVLYSAPIAQVSALALVVFAFLRAFTYESDLHEARLRRSASRANVAIGRITDVVGASIVLHADQARRARIVTGSEPNVWRLSVPARTLRGRSTPEFHEIGGSEAVRALRLALTEAGPVRAGARAVRAATDAIEAAGGARAFLAASPDEIARRGFRYALLEELPIGLRLALEIAADEVYEASVLEEDLAPQLRDRLEAGELAPA